MEEHALVPAFGEVIDVGDGGRLELAAQRPGFTPRLSSFSINANDSTTSLLSSSRKPNGSGLKQSVTASEDPDPLEVIEKLLNLPHNGRENTDGESSVGNVTTISSSSMESTEPGEFVCALRLLRSQRPRPDSSSSASPPRPADHGQIKKSKGKISEDLRKKAQKKAQQKAQRMAPTKSRVETESILL
ncbi:uncharacterized protein LY89DRAFT_691822 [Mollisia scopiformis]|uniref:Uncharacterized protein n=1 Tax=Mollisia scopiformis TaxID=149040 RepID=A0A132B5V1_MOLSC|nr:uncharacterized protein LY89DRAFT_691822 [Mollisia scopiformis]KUJ07369.1 hypothetical protein LY89DRAFT_691822 [Mollisia scopiformis]